MKTKTLNLHQLQRKLREYTANWPLYTLILLFLFGLILGVFSVRQGENGVTRLLIERHTAWLEGAPQRSAAGVFLASFAGSAAMLLATYFTGLSAVGIPFVGLLPAGFGFWLGAVSGHFYRTYLLRGLGYCAVIVFPPAILSIAALIYACRESVRMSYLMVQMLSQRRAPSDPSFRQYSLRYIWYLAVCAASALVSVGMQKLFLGIFRF